MQRDIEQRAITLLRDPESLGKFIQRGITSDDFVVNTELVDFLMKYYHKYNSIPADSVLKLEFPEFEVLDDVKPEEIKYLSDELIKHSVQRRAIKVINEASETIITDPYATIDTIVNKLSNVRKRMADTKSFTDKDSMRRFKAVSENKNRIAKGITIGIKTGISLFDDKYIGWQPGNLVGIAGRLGIGKSWIAIYLGCVAYHTGKRVVFVSPEMAIQEVELRWDTIMGNMRGTLLLNDKLITGEVNLKEYKDFLTESSKRADWLTIDSNHGRSFDVPGIAALVDEFAPDLVCIDGVHLLSGGGREGWEKIKEISYGLKSLALNKKVVVIASTQVNRSAGDEMPRPDQVSFGDAFMQACDFGVMISQDVEKPDVRYLTIPKRRTGGAAVNKRIEIKFSVNSGCISI